MAVRFSESPERFMARMEQRIKKTEKHLKEDLKEGIELGAEFMRERIVDLPRIDTWHMFNSVGTTMKGTNQHVTKGTFGWVRNQEDYFVYQEEGTQNVVAMFALSDAVDFVHGVLGDKVSETLRNG